MLIDDGKGTGAKARVDGNNRMHVHCVNESEEEHAIENGDGYNINTGNIVLSAAGTLLYMKNNEDRDLVITAIVIGIGEGTTSDSGEILVVRGPTGGNLISDGTVVDMNQNRNFGSSQTLTIDAFKGKSAGTLTGGDDIILIYAPAPSRTFAVINMVLEKGSEIAFTLDPKISSGTVKAYCAAICHLKDPQFKD